MATAKERKYARTYYKTHAKYRRERIEYRKDYYHEHQKEQNAYERKRYRTNQKYKAYKIAYAKAYQKKHKKR